MSSFELFQMVRAGLKIMVAILLIGTIAGCSSDLSRFSYYDALTTQSVNKPSMNTPHNNALLPAPLGSQKYPDQLSKPTTVFLKNQPNARQSLPAPSVPQNTSFVNRVDQVLLSEPTSPQLKTASQQASRKTLFPNEIDIPIPSDHNQGFMASRANKVKKTTKKQVEKQIPSAKIVTVASVNASVKKTEAEESQNSAKTKTQTIASINPEKDNLIQTAKVIDDNVTLPAKTGIEKLRWPAKGQISSGFGGKTDAGKRNYGLDILMPEDSPIKAAENGVVTYASDKFKGYGNTILIRHDENLVTVYAHAKTLNVKSGDKVRRGQVIAQSGMTGSAQRPKLHFEVRKNAVPQNPIDFLE